MAQAKRATDFVICSKGIRDFDQKSMPRLGFLKEVKDSMDKSLLRVVFLEKSNILIGNRCPKPSSSRESMIVLINPCSGYDFLRNLQL